MKSLKDICLMFLYEENIKNKALKPYRPVAEKRDIRTYANSEEAGQPAHPRSLTKIFVVRLQNIEILLKILY